jgi:hypothetical protein
VTRPGLPHCLACSVRSDPCRPSAWWRCSPPSTCWCRSTSSHRSRLRRHPSCRLRRCWSCRRCPGRPQCPYPLARRQQSSRPSARFRRCQFRLGPQIRCPRRHQTRVLRHPRSTSYRRWLLLRRSPTCLPPLPRLSPTWSSRRWPSNRPCPRLRRTPALLRPTTPRLSLSFHHLGPGRPHLLLQLLPRRRGDLSYTRLPREPSKKPTFGMKYCSRQYSFLLQRQWGYRPVHESPAVPLFEDWSERVDLLAAQSAIMTQYGVSAAVPENCSFLPPVGKIARTDERRPKVPLLPVVRFALRRTINPWRVLRVGVEAL